jgi:hypothetical protein
VSRLVSRAIDAQLAAKLGVPIPSQAEVNTAYASDAAQSGGDAALKEAALEKGYAGSELLAEVARETLQADLEKKLVAAKPPTSAQLHALYAQYQSQLQGATFASVESELVQVFAQSELAAQEQQLAASVGVHVNSRFGSWSAKQGLVVADLSPLSSAGAGAASALSGTTTITP